MGQRKERKLSKILKARELRKELTKAERLLWRYLRDRKFFGRKFRRQHIFRGFILDFYCPENKLAIELDGLVHLKQKDYDSLRQGCIEDFGVKVLRFRNKDILGDLKRVLKTIKDHLTFPSPSKVEKDVKDKVCN
jgi:very-short-patch-repair endonuclease